MQGVLEDVVPVAMGVDVLSRHEGNAANIRHGHGQCVSPVVVGVPPGANVGSAPKVLGLVPIFGVVALAEKVRVALSWKSATLMEPFASRFRYGTRKTVSAGVPGHMVTRGKGALSLETLVCRGSDWYDQNCCHTRLKRPTKRANLTR